MKSMPQRSPSKTFELFFTPRFPIFFAFGALALAVMGNTATDLLKLYFGSDAARLWLILAGAGAMLAFLVYGAYAAGAIRERAMADSYDVIDKPKPQQYRGLIAFVSLTQRAHLEKALNYHGEKLERIWLIATPDAEDLAQELKGESVAIGKAITVVPLDDQWELLRTKATVEHIYQTQLGGLAEEEVIADFTGGTKPMTVGMIFACLSPRRHLEYVPAGYESSNPEPLDPVEYFLDYSVASKSVPMSDG